MVDGPCAAQDAAQRVSLTTQLIGESFYRTQGRTVRFQCMMRKSSRTSELETAPLQDRRAYHSHF